MEIVRALIRADAVDFEVLDLLDEKWDDRLENIGLYPRKTLPRQFQEELRLSATLLSMGAARHRTALCGGNFAKGPKRRIPSPSTGCAWHDPSSTVSALFCPSLTMNGMV